MKNENKCTKPNCDCAEKEMQKQGTELIKSYPCLNVDLGCDELQDRFKKPNIWIEPNGRIG